MKLVIVCNTLAGGKGGAERVATDLAHEMHDRGHAVSLAFENRGDPAYPVDEGIKLLPFDEPQELAPSLQKPDADLVVVFYFNRRNLVRFVRLLDANSAPLVVQECTNPDRLRFNNWVLSGKTKVRACWEREIVTSISPRIRLVMPGYAETFSLFQQQQIRAFPNGAVVPSRCSAPGEACDGRFSILVINGFKPNKNLKDLVKAFALLAEGYPEWDIRVVGKEPNWSEPHAYEVKEVLDRHDLWNRVNISGPSDDIHSELAESHLHVIPSLSEGCPTVVLEAMATGVPTVGFAECPGTNELIDHGRNGLLASGEDRVGTLANALKRLMSNSDERSKMGGFCRRDACAFEPKEVYRQWESLLCEAAEYAAAPDRLLREQQAIDYERANHARRMRNKVLED